MKLCHQYYSSKILFSRSLRPMRSYLLRHLMGFLSTLDPDNRNTFKTNANSKITSSCLKISDKEDKIFSGFP